MTRDVRIDLGQYLHCYNDERIETENKSISKETADDETRMGRVMKKDTMVRRNGK